MARGPEQAGGRPRRRARVTAVLIVAAVLLGGIGIAMTWPRADPPIASAKVDPPKPVDPNAAAAPCEADDLDVGLAADREAVTPGVPVNFTLSLRNTGRVQCLVEGSRQSLAVTVYHGEAGEPTAERAWSSADCADPGGERLLLLGPKDVDTTKVSWSDARSVPGCAPDQPKPAAGVYTAQVTLADVDGVSSDVVRLTYTVPEPSRSPSGKPSGKATGEPSGKPSVSPSDDASAEPTGAASTGPTDEASADPAKQS